MPKRSFAESFARGSACDRPVGTAGRFRAPSKSLSEPTPTAKPTYTLIRHSGKLCTYPHRYPYSSRHLDLRFSRRHVWAVMVFLVLGVVVATRETPEIMTLSDDVSNDGVVVGVEPAISPVAFRTLSERGQLPPSSSQSPRSLVSKKRPRPISPLILPTHMGRGLLQFVSVLRT